MTLAALSTSAAAGTKAGTEMKDKTCLETIKEVSALLNLLGVPSVLRETPHEPNSGFTLEQLRRGLLRK